MKKIALCIFALAVGALWVVGASRDATADPPGGASTCGCRATDGQSDMLCNNDPTANNGQCPDSQFSGTNGAACVGFGSRDTQVPWCDCETPAGDPLCSKPYTITGGNKACEADNGIQGFHGKNGDACSGSRYSEDPDTHLGKNVPATGKLTGCEAFHVYAYQRLRGTLEGCSDAVDAGAPDATDASDASDASKEECTGTGKSDHPEICYKRWATGAIGNQTATCAQGGIGYLPLQGAHRAGGVALLSPKTFETNYGRTNPSVDPPGFRSTLMDRGHLIGHQFGGADNKHENIVSQYINANEIHFKSFEMKLAAEAKKSGACIAYFVKPIYMGGAVIPEALEVTAVGKDFFEHRRFPNNPERVRPPRSPQPQHPPTGPHPHAM